MAGTGKAHLRPESETLLRAEDLTVEFPVGGTGDVVHAVSGVSIDEEMVNLIKFQNAYAAGARLIKVGTELLDILVNLGR